MPANDSLADYYARRASEYERIYAKPERQPDLDVLRTSLPELFAGHDVLEVACGTGYWTHLISRSAKSILATDILEIARQKSYPDTNVVFQPADAFTLDGVAGDLTAGFAAFWWSHIPKARIRPFLEKIHQKLRRNALVVFLDNNFVEGSSTPITRRDADGNTYQKRRLENGSEYEVLKNFPSAEELRDVVRLFGEGITVTPLEHYWCLRYALR